MAAGARVPRPADSLPGAPAPWSQLPEEQRRAITLDEVRRALAAFPGGLQAGSPPPEWKRVTPAELPSGADARPAAVLCLLFEHDGEANVVLTRRSVHLRSHSGEVSFPGGRLQPGELPLQAALREANEEIGVDAGAIEIIGQLTPLTTVRSPALVHCFVGCFRPPAPARLTFSFDPGEVEKVFWVSLAGLAVEGIYHEELWPALEDQGLTAHRSTTYRAVPFFGLDDDVVWGATGRLLTELVGTVLANRMASRPEGRSGLSGRYPGGA
jgi:8-oxo-dGTP pyrophosphatase MutT (NUDIX family)